MCQYQRWAQTLLHRITTANHLKDLLETNTAAGRSRHPFPLFPRSTVILLQLYKIFGYPLRRDAIMAENQFQGHQEKSKSEKLHSANRATGLCKKKRRDGGGFFHQHFGFPFAEGNQPAAPESLLLVKARSWFFLELLVMWSQVASN